jgi:hypothetical protein
MTGYPSLADIATSLADEAVEQDDYVAAGRFLAIAEKAARKAKTLALITKVQSRQKAVADAEKRFSELKLSLDTLKKKPEDPEANLAVGKFYCLVKNEWGKGLPFLARGQDAKLKAAADLELAKPEDGPKLLELANAWWEVANAEKTAAKRQYQMHTYRWYEKALPTVPPGLERTRVEKRIDTLIAQLPDLNSPLELRKFVGHTETVLCVLVSPDGKHLLSGSKDGTARLWDIETANEVQSFMPKSGWVKGLGFSKDGTCVLTGTHPPPAPGQRGKFQVARWEVESKRYLGGWSVEFGGDLKSSGLQPPLVAFPPQGGQFVIAETLKTPNGWQGGRLMFMDLENPIDIRQPLLERGATVSSMIIAFDGKKVLTGGEAQDQTLRLWDLETGTITGVGGRTAGVQCVALSGTGKRALSGGLDKTIHVWELATGKPMRSLIGHTGPVTCVAFSPDGNRVLSGSQDKTVRLWDVKSGKELCRFTNHSAAVNSIAFSPDGHRAVSGGDTTVRLYRLPR